MLLLFLLLKPAVSYLGCVALIVLLYTSVFNIYYTRKFLPEIRISKAFFEMKAVIELITSGIWNSIIRVGQLLLEGFDLLITNFFLNPVVMGTLAVAKPFPAFVAVLIGIIANVFVPDFTILYAQKKNEDLLVSIKRSMKILGLVTNIPIAIIVTFGVEFFTLWVPGEDPRQLQILSVITVFTCVISGSINSIYGVFTVTNRLKANAFMMIFTGLINLTIVIILLKVTSLGVYAVAGVSTILGIIRNLAFTVPYGAKCLNLKWTTFYPEVLKSVAGFLIVTAIGLVLNYFADIDSWLSLVIFAALAASLGLIINTVFMLNKSERKFLIELAGKKLINRR
jgi:O-antigen/teichoic acid export membrane protein